MRFWCQLGSILPPQFHQNPPKIDPKRHQNFDRFLLRFFFDFGSVLGAKLELCWPPFSFQDAPRGFQDAPRTPTKRPKTPPRHPKTPQDPPRTPPRRPKPSPEDDVATILRRFWKSLGRISWKMLLSNLPPLLEDFRFASLFCVRLIVQRSPAVLPLCGLNTNKNCI